MHALPRREDAPRSQGKGPTNAPSSHSNGAGPRQCHRQAQVWCHARMPLSGAQSFILKFRSYCRGQTFTS